MLHDDNQRRAAMDTGRHDKEPMLAPPVVAGSLIVTLRMGCDAVARFTALRRAHFPPERNWLDAHVTLFHALPPKAIERLSVDAAAIAATTPSFAMRTARLRSLGGGVAYELDSPEAERLRRHLASRWTPMLTRQDRAAVYCPHITVQNKVKPDQARALLAQLGAVFEPEDVPVTGLEFWHYADGPWRAAAFFPFGDTV